MSLVKLGLKDVISAVVSDHLHQCALLLQGLVAGFILDVDVPNLKLPDVVHVVVAITRTFYFCARVIGRVIQLLEFLQDHVVEARQDLLLLLLRHLLRSY